MGKIVINKNLAKYYYKFADNIFKPITTNSTVVGYSSPTTGTTAVISTIREIVLTKQSTITVLDKISTYYRNITLTDWVNDLALIINGILISSTRATTLAGLVTKGVITQSESDSILLINLTDRPVISSTLTNDVITFKMTNPNKLVRRYNKDTDNASNETLYLLFPYYTSITFNNIPHYGGNYYSYATTTSALSKQVLSYVAISMGTTGTEDIVLDYADNIDYIDDMDIKIKVPNTIII